MTRSCSLLRSLTKFFLPLQSSTIDLSLCLGGTSTSGLAQRTIVPKNGDKLLEKKDEIVANTLWRFLELRV